MSGLVLPCGQPAKLSSALLAISLAASIAGEAQAQPAACGTAAAPVEYAEQGWTAEDRRAFYGTSQGSHLMPYAWFKALRRADVDEPFAANELCRYGYLHNELADNNYGLPIGFVVDNRVTPPQVGLTCAACHTGQVEFQRDGVSHVMRIDGAPAKADIQQLVTDLIAASRATLADEGRFDAFAKAVLGANDTAANAAKLKTDFGDWFKGFSEFMRKSLPTPPWGPGRLDGFGMIFNRVVGLDLKKDRNITSADAPVRYPFLWNAPWQDHTEWNGGSPNGLSVLGLARNIGEVLGVFGEFAPTKHPGHGVDYSRNSVDFAGLEKLENLIVKLKPPKWPFKIDRQLADEGKPLYDAQCGRGCHEKSPSPYFGILGVWRTPRLAVETDPKMATKAARDAPDSGIFAGTFMPPPSFPKKFPKFPPTAAKSADILVASVIGIITHAQSSPAPATAMLESSALEKSGVWTTTSFAGTQAPKTLTSLNLGPLRESGKTLLADKKLVSLLYEQPPPAPAAYEARVLCGIWAAAPYLHNGSVPNLRELLTAPDKRVPSFMVGSRRYDPQNVGYAIDQSPFKDGTFETGPQNADGNGNGGHNYGTTLSDHQKAAIIEYMKTLDGDSPAC